MHYTTLKEGMNASEGNTLWLDNIMANDTTARYRRNGGRARILNMKIKTTRKSSSTNTQLEGRIPLRSRLTQLDHRSI